MGRIKVIQEQEAEGQLKEIYQELIKSRGKLAEVHKIQSLNPASIASHMQLYMDIMFAKSPLSRAQREILTSCRVFPPFLMSSKGANFVLLLILKIKTHESAHY